MSPVAIRDQKQWPRWCLLVHLILLLLFIISEQNGVCCTSNIIKTLPGFSGNLPFKLETGYVGVGDNEDVQLFYYFIDSEGNPREDPLMLRIVGGPGCSGISALGIEIGPLRFNLVEYNGSLPTWVPNPYSWTRVSSIIFIDAPVGTGFSYSKTLQGSKTGDWNFVKQGHEFMRKWLITHPEFIENPIYVSGGSYGGLIVPLLVNEMSNGNEAGLRPPLNLKGYLLANPVTNIHSDVNSRLQYANNMGLISDELYESTKRSCNGEYVDVDKGNLECTKDLEAVSECIGKLNLYHILEPECILIFGLLNKLQNEGRFLQENYVDALFSLPELPVVGCRNYPDLLCNIWANDISVQEALHIRKGTIGIWDRCNKSLNYVEEVNNTVEYHLNLTTRGIRALIYSGDRDIAVPYLATLSWMNSFNYSIIENWQPWFVDGQVAGYSRLYENQLTYTTIKGAGHTPAEDKPRQCFAMVKRWLSKQPF